MKINETQIKAINSVMQEWQSGDSPEGLDLAMRALIAAFDDKPNPRNKSPTESCGLCGFTLHEVRPGKHQCRRCETKPPKRGKAMTRTATQPRILRLTLKRKWFDMIASGEKREEYRTPSKWILSRLEGKEYDRIEFKNGYGQNVPTMEVEYLGWAYSFGKPQWGGGSEQGKPYATIYLGRVLSLRNMQNHK